MDCSVYYAVISACEEHCYKMSRPLRIRKRTEKGNRKAMIMNLAQLVFILHTVSIAGNFSWQEWGARVDSLSRCKGTGTITEVIGGEHKTFLSASFITVAGDFELIRGLFFDYEDSLAGIVPHIIRWERIDGTSTFFLEMGVSAITSYCVLTQDTVICDTSGFMKVRYKKNYDSTLNSILRKETRGFIVIDYKGYEFSWILLKLPTGETRLGREFMMKTDAFIPKWLYDFMMKHIFPRILSETTTEIGRRAEKRKARGENISALRVMPRQCCH